MKDRVPGAPGRYQGSLSVSEFEKLQKGKPFAITLTRDDAPIVAGTPYSKAAVLPDALAAKLCPGVDDPSPADALAALEKNKAPASLALLTERQTVRKTGEDLNDYTTQGLYYFTADYTPLNIPVGSNGWLWVIPGGASSAKQIWWRLGTINSTDHQSFTRTWTAASGWSAWERAGGIAAQGTSGKWTYRKWENGLAECWSEQTLTCDENTVATFSFPFLFTEKPMVLISPEHIIGNTLMGGIDGEATASGPGMYPGCDIYNGVIRVYVVESDGKLVPTSMNCGFNVYCIGKWK